MKVRRTEVILKSAQAEDQNTTENNNADKTKDNESYSKTVDGTTVTLSEVYCNEMALYLSMTIHTEDKFPDTFITPDGKPNIKLSENSTVKYDYMDEKVICSMLIWMEKCWMITPMHVFSVMIWLKPQKIIRNIMRNTMK